MVVSSPLAISRPVSASAFLKLAMTTALAGRYAGTGGADRRDDEARGRRHTSSDRRNRGTTGKAGPTLRHQRQGGLKWRSNLERRMPRKFYSQLTRLAQQTTRGDYRTRVADHRSASSSLGSRFALSARRGSQGHRQRPQRPRHGLLPMRLDVSRQRRRCDERQRPPWTGAGVRGDRRLRRSQPRRAHRSLAGGPPARQRALPWRSPLFGVGRRQNNQIHADPPAS